MRITPVTAALLTGAGLLAFYGFKKVSSSVNTLNFYPASLKNLRFEGITPVMTLGLAIQNPSSQSALLKAVVGTVSANGNVIGNVSSYQQATIAGPGQTVYPLIIRLSLLGIVQDIIQAFQGGGVSQKIELNAYANINDFNVPIKVVYQIP